MPKMMVKPRAIRANNIPISKPGNHRTRKNFHRPRPARLDFILLERLEWIDHVRRGHVKRVDDFQDDVAILPLWYWPMIPDPNSFWPLWLPLVANLIPFQGTINWSPGIMMLLAVFWMAAGLVDPAFSRTSTQVCTPVKALADAPLRSWPMFFL